MYSHYTHKHINIISRLPFTSSSLSTTTGYFSMFKFYVPLWFDTFLCSIKKYRWQKRLDSIKNRSYFLCNLAAKARELHLANQCTMLDYCFCSDLRNQKVEGHLRVIIALRQHYQCGHGVQCSMVVLQDWTYCERPLRCGSVGLDA